VSLRWRFPHLFLFPLGRFHPPPFVKHPLLPRPSWPRLAPPFLPPFFSCSGPVSMRGLIGPLSTVRLPFLFFPGCGARSLFFSSRTVFFLRPGALPQRGILFFVPLSQSGITFPCRTGAFFLSPPSLPGFSQLYLRGPLRCLPFAFALPSGATSDLLFLRFFL